MLGQGFDHCLRLPLELRFWVLVREMMVLWATVAAVVASLRGLQPTYGSKHQLACRLSDSEHYVRVVIALCKLCCATAKFYKHLILVLRLRPYNVKAAVHIC